MAVTVLGSTVVSMLAGSAAGLPVSFSGLVAPWVVCVRSRRVVQRPRLFRRVCAPVGQLWGAFFVPLSASADVGTEQNPWTLAGMWVFSVGVHVFMSVLSAGLLRDKDFSTGAGQGF